MMREAVVVKKIFKNSLEKRSMMKSSESDSYDDDDCNSQFDEVQQIKIAMV